MTDANGVVTTLAYDAIGRLITSTVQTAAGNAVTSFGYDAAGLLTSVTSPTIRCSTIPMTRRSV